ncbi:MAG TPA: SMP-30/gluconolactonase/LRE family protein [Prolixibacteraceae bacterium]|nr:SMP-30/gluconolactonase/LRE family protein [Prolixibacteraceae bacterium]
MKSTFLLPIKRLAVALGMVIATLPLVAQKNNTIIARDAQPVLMSGPFSFTEGPAADKAGNVYFTDQPNNKIYIWTTRGELKEFCGDCGRANGLYFDREGNLLSCSDEKNELWRISPSGERTVLVGTLNGRRLNGPNDLWVRPDGGIYFTDPLYARPWWTGREKTSQLDGQHVYFLAPGSSQPVRVTTDLKQPNGIIGTPDGKTLYVADIGDGKTYRYRISPDGTLNGKTLFAPMGSDGMTIDCKGNIYLTGQGVTVFNKKGKKIAHIPVEARWTANVCFGGADRKTLFITASENLFSLRMKVRGVK